MWNFFRNLFNINRVYEPPTHATFRFSNTRGQRIEVSIDQSLPVSEVVNRLNRAAGDISWRVSPEGRAEYIQNANCPLRNRTR